ncbi:hypothetical protein CHS0354_020083 [Potamilus streckersoni]|uniref:Uncharacterized protein n=1 Tax=Potamilus streckersoni TaxID=2493646 RepID=A0AAE0SBY5_9BIVA|nr:hypothetical protein CHS0354_020083 [Potamilus streckersoni]
MDQELFKPADEAITQQITWQASMAAYDEKETNFLERLNLNEPDQNPLPQKNPLSLPKLNIKLQEMYDITY